MSARPDCYACRYRAAVPGDTHSECRAPGASLVRGIQFMSAALDDPESQDVRFTWQDPPAMEISFAAHGVRNAWATWPLAFDPTWLRTCTAWAPQPKLEDEHAS